MPEMDVEGQAPRVVQVDVPPEFQEQEQLNRQNQNLGQPEPEEAEVRLASIPEQAAPEMPVDTRDADELAAAQEHDRQSRNAGRFELAAKQFVSGVTQTPQASLSQPAPSRVPGAMSAAEARRRAVVAEILRKRQAGQDAMAADENKSQKELRDAQIADLVRKRRGGADGGELESYKAVMSQRYPQAAALINGLTSMKGAQDLQNSLDSEAGRETTIKAAQIAAGATRREARDVRADAKADAEAKRVEDEAKKLADEMKGRGVMSKRLRDLESTIPQSGSVPGTGIMGDAIAWFDSKAGTDFQSPEAIKVRQNIGLLMSAILREQSGATVSEQEYARAVQNGLSTKNAATTRAALKRLHEEFAIGDKEIRTKYPKAAIETYEKRAGTPGGKVRMSNGKETLMVDAGDVDAAKADGFRVAQ
jgi:hypothetical protein